MIYVTKSVPLKVLTCGIVNAAHLYSSSGAGPIVLIGGGHHLTAGGQVAEIYTRSVS
jgi:hypothetical protein